MDTVKRLERVLRMIETRSEDPQEFLNERTDIREVIKDIQNPPPKPEIAIRYEMGPADLKMLQDNKELRYSMPGKDGHPLHLTIIPVYWNSDRCISEARPTAPYSLGTTEGTAKPAPDQASKLRDTVKDSEKGDS